MFSRQEKILLATFATINFCHILDFVIMMPLGPQLMRSLNLDPHQFGLLVSIYTFSAGVSGLVFSIFVDRYDRKNLLLLFFLGFTIGTFGCGLAQSYQVLLLARALTGTFGGVLGSLVMSATGDAINPERRGTAMGVIMGSFSVASVFGIPFGLYLANKNSWNTPFLVLAVLSCVIAIAAKISLPSMKEHLKGPRHHENNIFFPFKHILGSKNQLIAIAFIFSVIFGQFALIPFLSPSFVANAGLNESDLPLIYLIGGIVSFFSSPFFGKLADKFGKPKIFYVGATLSLVPVWIITHLDSSPTWMILTISSSFFMCMGGRMVPAMAILSSAAPLGSRGSFMSVSTSIQQMAAAASSYISGIIVVKNASGNLINYPYVGYITIAFTFLAMTIVGKIRVES
ncbi:MAG: sugar transporter [Proteobacteria bacterium SG_bin7]|nr:MAG: sugar transporter [Proteobacteria bacterium SG_bin7]